jgi:hypothetical protein
MAPSARASSMTIREELDTMNVGFGRALAEQDAQRLAA